MKLIVIYATANRGKTTMLENVIHFLQPELNLSNERSFVISVNGTKIGIALDGDDEETVSNNLELFMKANCDLIVTPSHIKDKTVLAVNMFAQKYELEPIWIKKAELSEYLEDYYDELNKYEAKFFVDYLKRNFI